MTASRMLSADIPDPCHLKIKNLFIIMYNSTPHQWFSTARQDKFLQAQTAFNTKRNKPMRIP
jgi:hypothetical protein